jgi:hypothetical protein
VYDRKFGATLVIKYWQEYHIPDDCNNKLHPNKGGHWSCVAVGMSVALRQRLRKRGRERKRERET